MSEVTEADRARAAMVAERLSLTSGVLGQREVIAAALAAEREKARAPFLAALRWSDDGPADEAPSYREVVDRIRRAAEEGR